MSWYKSGTVSVAQNSNAVIGTGTAFIANGRVGDAFQGPDGDWYEVTNIAGDTAMSIAPNYRGATNAAGTYALAPMQGYVKATADALREASLQVGGAIDGLEDAVAEAAASAATASSAKNDSQASATAAAWSASDAEVSKSDAASSATASATSANGAANSATAANTSKVAAGQSETNAATSATNSANSATASAGSATSAAASAATAASLGVGKGYIDGLRMVYTGRNSITIQGGSAYLPSSGKVVSRLADKVFTGLTLTGSAFHHVYAYENAGAMDLEISITAPVLLYGSVYQKTGDSTRRYIGSALASSGSQFWSFRHDADLGLITYTEGYPGSAPFVMYSAYTNSTPLIVSLQLIVPKQTATIINLCCGLGVAYFSPREQAASPGGANWGSQAGGSNQVSVPLSRAVLAQQGDLYYWTGATATSAFVLGYYFER